MQNFNPSPRRVVVFIGTVIGTTIGGFAIGLMGSLIGTFLLRNEFSGFGGFTGAITGMKVSYLIGVVAGLLVASKVFHRRGSLFFGSLGLSWA